MITYITFWGNLFLVMLQFFRPILKLFLTLNKFLLHWKFVSFKVNFCNFTNFAINWWKSIMLENILSLFAAIFTQICQVRLVSSNIVWFRNVVKTLWKDSVLSKLDVVCKIVWKCKQWNYIFELYFCDISELKLGVIFQPFWLWPKHITEIPKFSAALAYFKESLYVHVFKNNKIMRSIQL